jgi:hypothetical protein
VTQDPLPNPVNVNESALAAVGRAKNAIVRRPNRKILFISIPPPNVAVVVARLARF